MPAALTPRPPTDLDTLAASTDRIERLTAAWLLSVDSDYTRRAYAGDLRLWLSFCATLDLDPTAADRAQVDAWIYHMRNTLTVRGAPPAESTIGRRLSAVASWYEYLVDAGVRDRSPVHRKSRPRVDNHTSLTVGLSRDEARDFLAALDARDGDGGYLETRRTRAALHVLIHTGIRVGELGDLTIGSLGINRGHVTITVQGKGRKVRVLVLPPPAIRAVSSYLAERARTAGVAKEELPVGEALIPGRVDRLTDKAVARMIQRIARRAGITSWARLSPHSLRHTAATLALDAGAPIRDVQDLLGHTDPRTTRRYDRARGALDRSPSYALATFIAPDDDGAPDNDEREAS